MLGIHQIYGRRVQLNIILPLLCRYYYASRTDNMLSTNVKTLRKTRNTPSRPVTVTRLYSSNKHNSKVPKVPTWEPLGEDRIPSLPQVSSDLVDKLERLALVDFRTKEGLVCLERAIRQLFLRGDTVTEGDCAEKLLPLSNTTVEEYFVAPPGNIPLPRREERASMLKHSEF
ncbi:glutamyl-tRNA(Gln) amidotransferase subunit C, mitochondrial isoform X2 [Gadus macrocephalus]|uniref:glutamyl-tRNA(Gln) amidotransferase subunit C, mitochondrial isoform X2 n=1 Tax=Gadus macrocephalus TaxID=80720 RepID=UPI0028CB5863|nr:glutamyl-tRNA(Gln) amidotransferase subunit C, mitochondrial isoform X2 [Gadus macrocephalus]